MEQKYEVQESVCTSNRLLVCKIAEAGGVFLVVAMQFSVRIC
jgi:hypothetical protein